MPQKHALLLSDTTKYHHPSLLLRERTGRGNCGDQGMTDGTPQEGRWLAQLPWKGGGRVYHSTEEKSRVHVLGIRMALPTGGHGLVRPRGCLSEPGSDAHRSAGISSNCFRAILEFSRRVKRSPLMGLQNKVTSSIARSNTCSAPGMGRGREITISTVTGAALSTQQQCASHRGEPGCLCGRGSPHEASHLQSPLNLSLASPKLLTPLGKQRQLTQVK